MKTINWSTKAVRQLRKILDLGEQDKIYHGIQALIHFPECRNVKKLESRDQYRLRVGRWRVLFSESLEIIEIQEVKKRNGRTY